MPDANTLVKPNKTRKGLSIGLVLFALVIGLWWGIPTYRKAKADAMVQALCAKDGGVKVYETVRLPAERFDEFGEVRVPHSQYRKPDDEFFYVSENTWIVPQRSGVSELNVWRGHDKLFRVRDNKLLGEAIYYGRSGGDPIGPWHPSSSSCPQRSSIKYLAQQTFAKQ